ncbi:MAG: glycine cleavage system transcriptional repressor [Miltoncostaeaceae bacterium]|jgi:glycine cleavage system transcriptional repressor|nr:glycine cleavage system transcriptional repressor [Miltoncostaeaceae bacterium]
MAAGAAPRIPSTNVRVVGELAITAIGADRPGIVAGLTEALLALEGNLEDCRAALLRGSFAMVMVVAVPDRIDSTACQAALSPVADRLGLRLWVGPAEPPAPHAAGELLVISVYGADHPGIVHGVAAALAERGANIVDLSSRTVGDPPLYVLGIEAELPPEASPAEVERALRAVAARNRVELHIEIESETTL